MTQPRANRAVPGQSAEDVMRLESFVRGKWSVGQDTAEVPSAVTGDVIALATGGGFDMREILAFGRTVGGNNLRRLTFHQRAAMLKKLAEHLTEHKEPLYKLSFQTGATRTDAMIDVDGGINTLYAYAGKGRRELPNSKFLLDGDIEGLSKGRDVRRPARRDAAARRSGPHQRVQLSLLGHAREAGPCPTRGRSRRHQARHRHVLPRP
jgi:oxepin-CoA hydrolase/3-oxo-5,6-dehydrosuberyl-CoA semialdehyde dehydrogenase